MPKFVILTHDHPHLHWDLMLEMDGGLWTWRLELEPDRFNCEAGINAIRLPDHRLQYLDYEGPVSGNRGTVTRWDQGDYEIVNKSDTSIQINFRGGNLNRAMLLVGNDFDDGWIFQSAES